MYDFIKKNIYLIILFIITLSIGFLTFLTFIDKGFIELTDQNLQILLVLISSLNVILLFKFSPFINLTFKLLSINNVASSVILLFCLFVRIYKSLNLNA